MNSDELFQKLVKSKLTAILSLLLIFSIRCSKSPDIIVQNMTMQMPIASQIFSELLQYGEIAGTKIEHVGYAGPFSQTIQLSEENTNIFLFIRGKGELRADTFIYSIIPETIAIPFSFSSITIHVSEGDTLHFVRLTKKLTQQDNDDMKTFSPENKYDIYFKKFVECEPYTEKIKSPKTVSRTVLPADIVPRVSLGTVQTSGPDEVGAHKHPMLDQLFLGLAGNDIVVYADIKSAELKEFSLLHIPIGSGHWASVDNDKKMYYMWMDFFITREGQEWLKTHKSISVEKRN